MTVKIVKCVRLRLHIGGKKTQFQTILKKIFALIQTKHVKIFTLGLGNNTFVVFELKMKVIENTDDINCNSALYLLPRSHPIVLRRKYKIIIICLISQSDWNTLIGQVQISELSDW